MHRPHQPHRTCSFRPSIQHRTCSIGVDTNTNVSASVDATQFCAHNNPQIQHLHTHTHHGRNDAASEAHHGIQQERRFWGVGAMQHNETLCDACMPRPVYFRLRSPSSSSSLLPPAASSVAVASSRNFATFLFSSCRARSRGDLPSLSLMSSKDLSYAYNTLAATRLPWKAAQCREFHPSPSTTLGFPPRAITELIASSVSCPPKSPLSTIRGVHLFSVDFWLQFSLLTAFTNFLTSA
mmetsp:Transcript_5443/g.11469  ORF Transcript_5443/g.11469 Transcript_5443/m.11469 type:complete len:238 (-) Transcript_5443:1080-1793(-)